MAGSTVLYHINKHPDLFPKPQKSHYHSSLRNIPEKVIWLTPNYYEVMNKHGRTGNIHSFQVDNGLIEDAGGIKEFDGAMEIMFDDVLWQQGLSDGKIKYLGKVQENKLPKKYKHNLTPKKRELPVTGNYDKHPIFKKIWRLFNNGYISIDTETKLEHELIKYIQSQNTNGIQDLEDKIEYYYKHPESKDEKPRPKPNQVITAFDIELYNELFKINDKIKYSLLPKRIKEYLLQISDEISNQMTKEIKPSEINKTYYEIKGMVANLKVQLAKALENEISVSDYINRTAEFATTFRNAINK